jgi:hypothetical protein
MPKALPPAILSLYRTMLRLASKLPPAQSKSALHEIRTQFRANRVLPEGQEIGGEYHRELLANAEKRMNFMKILVPRLKENNESSTTGSGVRKFVFYEGKVVDRSAASFDRSSRVMSGWREGNVDPDQISRHRALLERQHFGGSFWRGKN